MKAGVEERVRDEGANLRTLANTAQPAGDRAVSDDEAELLSPLYLPPPPPPSHRSASTASLRHFAPIEFPSRLAKEIGLSTSSSKKSLPPAAVEGGGGAAGAFEEEDVWEGHDQSKQVALNRYKFGRRVRELRESQQMFFFENMGGLAVRQRTGHGVSVGSARLSDDQLVANVMASHDRARVARRISIQRDAHGSLTRRWTQSAPKL